MAGEEANDCKLEIISSTFRVRTVRVADSTKLAHVSIMQGRSGQKALPAIYTLYKQKLHEKCEKGDCPVAGELTSDQSRGKETDGFVIHVKDPTGSPSVESVPWIFRQTRENPIYTPVLKDAKCPKQTCTKQTSTSSSRQRAIEKS
ncbi:hypothetical protein OS493_001152 [Desmophyllum pertusum]|uniref:Uncharacterized protein n=1 Tax=Desmophyllum pertusum TaxID=174260 RepID=A0A9X0D6W5_9CNID|nr:hypothetical protein OS493_001152 [Desmophyllum pertusum]